MNDVQQSVKRGPGKALQGGREAAAVEIMVSKVPGRRKVQRARQAKKRKSVPMWRVGVEKEERCACGGGRGVEEKWVDRARSLVHLQP